MTGPLPVRYVQDCSTLDHFLHCPVVLTGANDATPSRADVSARRSLKFHPSSAPSPRACRSLSVMPPVDVPDADHRLDAGRPALADRPAAARPVLADLASRTHRSQPSRFSCSLIRSLIHLSSQVAADPRQLRSSQVTDGPGQSRTPGRILGKRVGGNPSGVRISYPPPPPDQAINQVGHAFGLCPQGCVVSFVVSFILRISV